MNSHYSHFSVETKQGQTLETKTAIMLKNWPETSFSSPFVSEEDIFLWGRYLASSVAIVAWRTPGSQNPLLSHDPVRPIRACWSEHRSWAISIDSAKTSLSVAWDPRMTEHDSEPRESEGCCGFSSSCGKISWSWAWASHGRGPLAWCLSALFTWLFPQGQDDTLGDSHLNRIRRSTGRKWEVSADILSPSWMDNSPGSHNNQQPLGVSGMPATVWRAVMHSKCSLFLLLSAYSVPATIPRTSEDLTLLILSTIPWGRFCYYHHHFTGKKTKAEKEWLTCSRSQSWNMVERTLNSGKSPFNYLNPQVMAQTEKNLPAAQSAWVWSLGWEDPLEEGMATHSSVLSWRIPMDRGAWRAAVCRVTQSRTWLSD